MRLMRATSLRILVLPVILAATVTSACAGSIWAKANNPRPLYSDDIARQIGDVLTITISEQTVIANGTTRGMSKKSSRSAAIEGNWNILNVLDKISGGLFGIPHTRISTDAETKFDGSADYDTDRKMEDLITVNVTDVLPNGNLIVVGSRDRTVAGDTHTVQISGIVRPSDISFSNNVSSENVSEFKVVFSNVGREKRFTRPGWFSRVLNMFNPF